MGLIRGIDSFKAGFSSTNEIYQALGRGILARNQTWIVVNVAIGMFAALGVGLALRASNDGAFPTGPALVVLALYGLTALTLIVAGRRLDGYRRLARD